VPFVSIAVSVPQKWKQDAVFCKIDTLNGSVMPSHTVATKPNVSNTGLGPLRSYRNAWLHLARVAAWTVFRGPPRQIGVLPSEAWLQRCQPVRCQNWRYRRFCKSQQIIYARNTYSSPEDGRPKPAADSYYADCRLLACTGTPDLRLSLLA
jgi:hypothetical protein